MKCGECGKLIADLPHVIRKHMEGHGIMPDLTRRTQPINPPESRVNRDLYEYEVERSLKLQAKRRRGESLLPKRRKRS